LRKITLEEIERTPDIKGIFRLEEVQYHKLKRVSSSALKAFLKSPKEAESYLNPEVDSPESEWTPALVFGSAFHKLILEPAEFDAEYIIEPMLDGPKNKNPWKQQWDKFKATAVGRRIVLYKDWMKMNAMRQNLADNMWYQDFMDDVSATECTLLWNDPVTGLPCKARPDALHMDRGIMDVKTMGEIPTSSECLRAISKYDYQLQDVHYLAGLKVVCPEVPQRFQFLFCSKAGAMDNANIKISASDKAFWTGIYHTLLSQVNACYKENYYPGVNKEVQEVELPRWVNERYV